MNEISTYHCGSCKHFLVAITPSLAKFPRRKTSSLSSTETTIIIPRAKEANHIVKMDAYRDRYPIEIVDDNTKKHEIWWVYKCQRCKIPIGYDLDLDTKDQRATFIFEKSLIDTEELKKQSINLKSEIQPMRS